MKSKNAGDQNIFRFWRLIGLGAILMFLEDVYDTRHHIRNFIADRAGDGSYGTIGTLFELVYFAALGAVLVYAFLRYRKVFWEYTTTRRYFIVGYGFYCVAVLSSWLGTAFRDVLGTDLYTLVGGALGDVLFGGQAETAEIYHEANAYLASIGYQPVGYWFMDTVFEESLELLGAAALLVAGLSFYLRYHSHEKH